MNILAIPPARPMGWESTSGVDFSELAGLVMVRGSSGGAWDRLAVAQGLATHNHDLFPLIEAGKNFDLPLMATPRADNPQAGHPILNHEDIIQLPPGE
jgi:hypothetical protein